MELVIEVLRIGQRLVRDDRVTTHIALVARAFGAKKIYMTEVNPEIRETISKINDTWGGNFELEFCEDWMSVLKERKRHGLKIVHLTMYGQEINRVQNIIDDIIDDLDILIIVGAEKVPREIYNIADYNVSIGNQPHSEISALGVFLDRIQHGRQFEYTFSEAKRSIIPTAKGKNVYVKTRD